MRRTKYAIIALVISVILLIPIGIYGYFVVNAEDYVEIWEPEKKSKKNTSKEEATEIAVETEETTVGEDQPVAKEQPTAEPIPAAEPAPAPAPAQPTTVIVGTRKKDVTPKTADFGMDSRYLLCSVLGFAGISVLLFSKRRETEIELQSHNHAPEKRRWEIAWEESKKEKNYAKRRI